MTLRAYVCGCAGVSQTFIKHSQREVVDAQRRTQKKLQEAEDWREPERVVFVFDCGKSRGMLLV